MEKNVDLTIWSHEEESAHLAQHFYDPLSGGMQLVLYRLLAEAERRCNFLYRQLVFVPHGIDPAHLPGQFIHGAFPDGVHLFVLKLFVGLWSFFPLIGHMVHHHIPFSFGSAQVIYNAMLYDGVEIIPERSVDMNRLTFVPEADEDFLQHVIGFVRSIEPVLYIREDGIGEPVENFIKSS